MKNLIVTAPYSNKQINDLEIGAEKWWRGSEPPDNWIFEKGQLLLRDEFPYLYDFSVKNNLIVSEQDWQTSKLYGYFSYGDNSDTFRLPDIRGLSFVGYEDGYHEKLGQYQQDQIVNITGAVDFRSNGGIGTGAFYRGAAISGYAGTGGTAEAQGSWQFNASRVVNTGERVQTRSITSNMIIKFR